MSHIVPRFFEPQELFPKAKCQQYAGRLDRLWIVLDPRVIITIDRLRERWGALRINDWNAGGTLQHRGWRPHTFTGGAALSQHRWGRATDISSWRGGVTADEMRADCIANKDHPAFEFVSRIESGLDAPTWFHWDCGQRVRRRGEDIIIVRAR